ncbi:hypothetical protein PROFUN_03792, partial [Planoprotostelium fungivorum]
TPLHQMVKAYLRYSPSASFGVICSGSLTVDPNTQYVLSAALEVVNIWNTKKGELVGSLQDAKAKSNVTSLLMSPNNRSVAVGYFDGSIRVYNLGDRTLTSTFNGHNKRITCLNFNDDGSILLSGSADTDIVVWDIVGEQGLYRLKGHRNEITDLFYLEKSKKIVSTSKDTLLKVWDTDLRTCIATVVGHREEIWTVHINPEGTRMVTATSGPRIHMWSLNPTEFHLIKTGINVEDIEGETPEDTSSDGDSFARYIGKIDRKSTERVSRLRFSPDGRTLAVQTSGRQIELFHVSDEERASSRRKRRALRKKEKKKEETVNVAHFSATDELEEMQIVTATGDLNCFSFSGNEQLVLGLNTNKIEVFKLKKKEGEEGQVFESAHELTLPGHRSDVRDVCISVDDTLVMTTSNTEIKIWNVESQRCIRTIASGYGMCGNFVPGNRMVVIGTKKGPLEVYDINSGECVQMVDAHTACIWGLQVKPDKTGMVTGSADKHIKFWEFELAQSSTTQGKQLSLKHTRTLKMSDDVLSVRYSPDCKYVAASLLDNTVKVFYEDSLQFYLSLYGHRLPVLSVDFSSDGTLIATGSADKNIKFWGTDFGDCHKSIFAHDDSITSVRFVNKTHYLFSASKDKTIKYWDADTYDHVQTIDPHHGAVWALATSRNGNFIASCSHDKSIRFQIRTDEQLFLSEERNKEMEELLDDEEVRGNRGEEDGDRATKKSVETIRQGEQLLEALDLARSEMKELKEYEEDLTAAKRDLDAGRVQGTLSSLVEAPTPNLALLGLTPQEYVLKTLKEIKLTELEESLRVLPFVSAVELLDYMVTWTANNTQTEIVCRALFFLMNTFHDQICSHPEIASTMHKLRQNVHKALQQTKDIMGVNRAALNFHKRRIEQETTHEFFEDAMKKRKNLVRELTQ